jgi:nicotinate-nucleotide pyrophosphorylase (carboxylating)
LKYDDSKVLVESRIEEIVECALLEDDVRHDVTTDALIPVDQDGIAYLTSKECGILAGVSIACKVFYKVDNSLVVDGKVEDGSRIQSGDVIATIEGKICGMLRAERVALNFLQRLSGIATETNRYVEAIQGLPVRILDTRKTTPGLRMLEKYAVRLGGGENHRMNLSESILIKDNHLAVLYHRGLNLQEILKKARQNTSPQIKIEVEVTSPEEALQAVEAGADTIMLDNMSLEDMRRAVTLIHGRALIEASGGITLDVVRAVAETGVNFISIGALTHSVKSLDISLDIRPLS